MVGVDKAGRGDIGKVTTYRHHAQVLGTELDLRVIRVKLPETRGCALCFVLCHVMSSIENKVVRFCKKKGWAIPLMPFILCFPYGIKVIPESFFCQGCQ